MVAEPLRQVMLAAEGAGDLTGAGVVAGTAEHPVCGDQVQLHLRLREGRVVEVAWRASGCPACVAVAAAAHQALPGCTPDEIPAALAVRLGSLGGLAAHERHAERLVLTAARRALEGRGP